MGCPRILFRLGLFLFGRQDQEAYPLRPKYECVEDIGQIGTEHIMDAMCEI